MNLTEREQNLLLRALDKASSTTEADKAAEALIESLRKRGISGYDFLDKFKATYTPPTPSTPQPQPTSAKRGWEGWTWNPSTEFKHVLWALRRLAMIGFAVFAMLVLAIGIAMPRRSVPNVTTRELVESLGWPAEGPVATLAPAAASETADVLGRGEVGAPIPGAAVVPGRTPTLDDVIKEVDMHAAKERAGAAARLEADLQRERESDARYVKEAQEATAQWNKSQ
jgi:hypothetical protein